MKNRKTYSWNTDMIEDTTKIHQFFKDSKKYEHNYKVSDYVLDGESAYLFYNLINNIYSGTLYISISDNLRKEYVLKKLKMAGITFVRILRSRPHSIVSTFINKTKNDVDGVSKMINIWTYEKLFLYLDTYNLQADQTLVAANKLKQECDTKKLKNLMDVHSSTKRPISVHVKDYFNDKDDIRYPVRKQETTDLVYKILKITDTNRVLFGGVGVEVNIRNSSSADIRHTKDIDFLSSRKTLKEVKSSLRKSGLSFIDTREPSYTEGRDQTVIKIKSNENINSSKKDLMKIDIDHKMSDTDFKELKKMNIIYKIENIGYVLCLEGIICCKLFAITNSILPSGKWHARIVKDILDISLLYKFVGINKDTLKIAYEQLEERGITEIKISNFSKVLEIVENDEEFQDTFLKIIERNSFSNNDFNITKYLKNAFEIILN